MSPGPSRISSCTASHDRLRLVAVVARVVADRPVPDLHGVRAAGHLDHRRAAEVGGEAGRVDRGRGDDQLEVRPLREELAEVAEEEVDVEAALVGLVDDQHLVGAQQAVPLDLGEQDAVGHHLDVRVRAHSVVEADRVADRLADLGAELLGDALGHRPGGQPAGLRVPDQAAHAEAQLEAQLRAAACSCPTRSPPRPPRPGGRGWRRGARPGGRRRAGRGSGAWAGPPAAAPGGRRSVTAGCSACSSRGP